MSYFVTSVLLLCSNPLFREANICDQCWRFMIVAVLILDRALRGREGEGYREMEKQREGGINTVVYVCLDLMWKHKMSHTHSSSGVCPI